MVYRLEKAYTTWGGGLGGGEKWQVIEDQKRALPGR
jgi:hypothetical protein